MAMGHIPKKDSDGNPIYRIKSVSVDDSIRVRHRKLFKSTVAASTAADFDWQIDQLQWQGQNAPSIMTGVHYKVIGGEDINPPEIDFCVIDIDDILGYGPNTVLDGFADDYMMFTDETSIIREHRADLITGLYIRAHVNNVGNTSITFLCNLLRYIDTSEL